MNDHHHFFYKTVSKSPKSVAFPVVAIVTNSIVFDYQEMDFVVPPANIPRVDDDKGTRPTVSMLFLQIFVAFPSDCILKNQVPLCMNPDLNPPP